METDSDEQYLRYIFNDDGKIMGFETRGYVCTTYTYGKDAVPILPLDVRMLSSRSYLEENDGNP